MGGLFRAPKPEPVPPPPPPAVQTPSPPTPEAAAAEARVAARERSQRGRPGTIATSGRGILDALPTAARKTLLGE